MLPAPRAIISNALARFNEGGVFVALETARFDVASSLQDACLLQLANGNSSLGMNAGAVTCADVADDVYREVIADAGLLRFFLDTLASQGFSVDVLSFGPISWAPASNSFAEHYENMTRQHACSTWWSVSERLGCGASP